MVSQHLSLVLIPCNEHYHTSAIFHLKHNPTEQESCWKTKYGGIWFRGILDAGTSMCSWNHTQSLLKVIPFSCNLRASSRVTLSKPNWTALQMYHSSQVDHLQDFPVNQANIALSLNQERNLIPFSEWEQSKMGCLISEGCICFATVNL